MDRSDQTPYAEAGDVSSTGLLGLNWGSLTPPYANLSNITINIAPLTGNVLATTLGQLNANTPLTQTTPTITLDDNAAGYGWFVDTTPADNSEFLPTHNPNEWVAKEGSAAAGKMDLLTVLLHEYGHVLGMEHTEGAHDAMSATLTPGVRRLPTASEFALIQQRIAELSGQGGTRVDALESLRLVLTPNGAINAAAPLGTVAGTAHSTFAAVQFEVAANPSLQNAAFTDGTNGLAGWATSGTVRTGGSGATLVENPTAQTRLNQVFMLGENDRYLRFTLDSLALDDADQGPDDAFEVALIDANRTPGSTQSLLGSLGLTRTDAFLNLQANGRSYSAQRLSSIRLADGSTQYTLDLQGVVAPGTRRAVNLSFDLIGFAQRVSQSEAPRDSSSHVSVRDIQLLTQLPDTEPAPIAADQTLSVQEDTTARGNLLATAQAAGIPSDQLRVTLQDAPQHGIITLNPDGTFSYTPSTDFNGQDRFSYRVSRVEGGVVVHASTAGVAVSVTPANDAPTARAAAFTTAEDTPLTLPLSSLMADVDSALIRARIISGPLHGTLSTEDGRSFTYTPDRDYFGEDAFTFVAFDGERDSAPARVTLTITPVDDSSAPASVVTPPVEGSAQTPLPGLSPINVRELGTSILSDPRRDGLLLPEEGGSFYRADFRFNAEPASHQSPSDIVRVPTDSQVPKPGELRRNPVAREDDGCVIKDGLVRIDLLANDLLPEQGGFRPIVLRSPDHGELEVHPDGTVSYRPHAGFVGVDRFTYILSDGRLGSAPATVTITVSDVSQTCEGEPGKLPAAASVQPNETNRPPQTPTAVAPDTASGFEAPAAQSAASAEPPRSSDVRFTRMASGVGGAVIVGATAIGAIAMGRQRRRSRHANSIQLHAEFAAGQTKTPPKRRFRFGLPWARSKQKSRVDWQAKPAQDFALSERWQSAGKNDADTAPATAPLPASFVGMKVDFQDKGGQ